MALYLNMEGSNGNRFQLPSMTFTEVVLDMSTIRKTDYTRFYLDARSGIGFAYFQSNTNGTDSWSTFNNVYVDNVSKTNNTVMVPNNQRCTVRVVKATAGTDDLTIFSNNGGSANTSMQGNLYDVKIFNGATLVAHYDMTTGTVQDQSGNGRHATLTGGTWVDDGVGGGGSVIDAGTITISAESNLTSSASRILTSSADLQADTTFTVSAQRILNGVSSISAETALSAIANKILNGMTTLSGESNLTAEADVLTVGISVNLTAESNLSATGTKVLRGETTLFANGEVIGTGSLVISGEAMLSAESDLSLFIGEYYTQVIEVVLNIKTSADVNLNVKRSSDYDLNV